MLEIASNYSRTVSIEEFTCLGRGIGIIVDFTEREGDFLPFLPATKAY
jgi:hypothetical protein